jgi:hypothetical protein
MRLALGDMVFCRVQMAQENRAVHGGKVNSAKPGGLPKVDAG